VQNICADIDKLLDTIFALNTKMKALDNDTAVKKKFLKQYHGLNFLGDTIRSIGVPAVIFTIPAHYVDSVRVCLLEKSNQNKWFITWKKKDENNFQGFNIYDSPEKRNRILYYASFPLNRRKIDLAISVY
jgi:hypothetical protein